MIEKDGVVGWSTEGGARDDLQMVYTLARRPSAVGVQDAASNTGHNFVVVVIVVIVVVVSHL